MNEFLTFFKREREGEADRDRERDGQIDRQIYKSRRNAKVVESFLDVNLKLRLNFIIIYQYQIRCRCLHFMKLGEMPAPTSLSLSYPTLLTSFSVGI